MNIIGRSRIRALGAERTYWLTLVAAFLALVFAANVLAQAPAASGSAPVEFSDEELEQLVAPIALYPDDLVAIILPASVNPLQLVQADRFLERRKADPKAPVDERWDEAVKSLLNYPEVVKKMSNDLDWTATLGEAVVTDQGEVLEAVQAFRRKVHGAGNLKTDEKQVVVVEKEVIQIQQANPEVIYVPQYNPTTVVVTGGYSSWGYYPAPYPVYYYPYPPGAAFATGLIWGAAIGAAWNGGHYHTDWSGGNNNINIDRSRNTTINRGDRASQRPAGGGSKWTPNKSPGQVSRSVGRTPSRVGDARPGGAGGVGSAGRPGGVGSAGGAGSIGGAGSRDRVGGAGPSQQPAGASRDRAGPSQQPAGASRDRAGGASPSQRDSFGGASSSRMSGSAFGDSGSRRQTQLNSSRGAASRSSMSGARSGGGGRRR